MNKSDRDIYGNRREEQQVFVDAGNYECVTRSDDTCKVSYNFSDISSAITTLGRTTGQCQECAGLRSSLPGGSCVQLQYRHFLQMGK